MIPDQIEASPSWLETDLLQDPNPGADLRLIWQVTQGILRQRLGRGSQLAFKRLQVEFSETDPEVLIAEIKDWLRTQFSDLTAQQFERTLREVK
jgi:hypothetical protein